LKVGRIAELSDPFDCCPRFINLKKVPPGGSKFPEEYLNLISGKWGLLCFSEKISDPVIWSHFADSHKGIALGFDFSKTDWTTEEVSYSSERPVFDMKLFSMPHPEALEISKKKISDAFTTKAPSWKYEAEHRSLIVLSGCVTEETHYFNPLPSAYLKKVVLGARCPLSMEEIKRIVYPDKEAIGLMRHPAPKYPDGIEISKCQINESGFDLAFDTLRQGPVKTKGD